MKPFMMFIVALITSSVYAQQYALPRDGFSIGVSASEFGYDVGIGVEVGSPCIRNTSIYFRAKGNVVWLEQYKAQYDQGANYKSANVSAVYNVFSEGRVGVFVDMGAYVIFPNSKFTRQKPVEGVTSSVGVELFVLTARQFNLCYYFNGGFSYSRAYADLLENKPRYANGFLFNNGLRIYLCRSK